MIRNTRFWVYDISIVIFIDKVCISNEKGIIGRLNEKKRCSKGKEKRLAALN
jgi:hypothetical protein